MAVRDGEAVGGIVAAPADARQKRLRPGVQMPASVGRLGMRLIAADEARRQPEAAAGGEKQHRDVAAGAVAERQRLGGRARRAGVADVVPNVGVERAVEQIEEGGGEPAAWCARRAAKAWTPMSRCGSTR